MMIVKYEGRSVQVRTVEKVAEKLLTVHSASSVFLSTMAIRVVEFSNGRYKIRRIFALESTYSKEIIEF